jgi:hypothetical protein|uniref:Uncharacterized protein n=1 Tax=candidate division WOR-3 bacterium TaxID=2052148 RepID=A0A7V3VU32_UNCW3
MKYIPWIIIFILILGGYYFYKNNYLPLHRTNERLEEEIQMWEETVKGEKGIRGDYERLPVEKLFENDKLTPYGEIEIMRRFDRHYKGIEIYISAPNALARLAEVLRFLNEQKLDYATMNLTGVVDSIERFGYKYIK